MSLLVFIETHENAIKKSSLEALCFSQELAKKLGVPLNGVIVNPSADLDCNLLSKYASLTLHKINATGLTHFNTLAYSEIMFQIAEKVAAEIIILSSTTSSLAISPRLAIKLKAGYAPNVMEFPTTDHQLPITDHSFTVKRGVYSGKGFAITSLLTKRKILTVKTNSFSLIPMEGKIEIIESSVTLPDSVFKTTVKEIVKTGGKIVLKEAEIVVAGGRGMKDSSNWGMLEELAQLLGAATACSKPVADMNWRPHSEHVGQTGTTISPNLYIAVGISGAIQHLAGVNSSKVIVVINKDKEAPFFQSADYGIEGDAFEVVPKLNQALKKANAIT